LSVTIGRPLPSWSEAGVVPVKSVPNAEALVHYVKAIGGASGEDAEAARRSVEELATIRRVLSASLYYDWSGSIGVQWEAATALIAFAEGKKDEGLKLTDTRSTRNPRCRRKAGVWVAVGVQKERMGNDP
jgi:hypothetical protein